MIPKWLEFDAENLTGKVVTLPEKKILICRSRNTLLSSCTRSNALFSSKSCPHDKQRYCKLREGFVD